MRIAMIGQKGIPATYGGVERHLEELSLRLVERGHSVTVYTRPHYTPSGSRRHKGIDLVSFRSLPTKHLDAISHTAVCSLHAAVRSADIVHYHAIGPALLSWLPRLAGKKVVCTIHGQDWRRPKWGRVASEALKLGERASIVLPHATISVSETLAEELSRTYCRPVQFVPNTKSTRFGETCSSLGIRQRTTRPYRPQTNGKAERFIRPLLQEWAYAELYLGNDERRRVLPEWLSYYNHDRPHTALGGSSPMLFLVNKACGHYSQRRWLLCRAADGEVL